MKTSKQNKKDGTQYGFKCEICSKSFFEKTLLREHKKIHEGRTHNCKLCMYKGKTVKYLSRHIKRIHTQPTIPCEVCGKKYHYQSGLKEHMLVHTGAKPYKCKACSKSFNSSYSLKTHKLIHENRKPFRCTMCDYACRDSSTLRKHKDRHLGKVKKYECDLCSKILKSKTYLRIHMNEIHFGLNVYTIPCDICGKMFKTNSTLTIHIKMIHGRQYECKCEICGAICLHKGNLQIHQNTHVKIRPYKCTFNGCGKKFKMRGDLKKHTVTHYPEQQHPCGVCGRRFARKSRLREHMRQHETKTAQCDVCGVWFCNKKYVALHILKNHNERYICDVCGFHTNNKTSIIMHLNTGHEDDHSCNICQKAFESYINLKTHYWKSHCVRYETKSETNCEKSTDVDMKEIVNVPVIDLFEVEKEEIMSDIEEYQNILDDENTKGDHKLNVIKYIENSEHDVRHNRVQEALDEVTDEENEEGRYEAMIEEIKRFKVTVVIDRETKQNAERHVHKLLEQGKRKREMEELEETRRKYNKRMKEEIEKKYKIGRTIFNNTNNNVNEKETNNHYNESQSNDSVSVNDNNHDKETDITERNGKFKINKHQCYICFKLFETIFKLNEHCKQHSDVRSDLMSKKCPLCAYVTKRNLSRHMSVVHKVDKQLPYTGSKDEKHKNNHRYYDIHDEIVGIYTIPNGDFKDSVKIDRKRQDKNLRVGKELLKEGTEEEIIEEYTIPEFNLNDITKINVVCNDYLGRIKKLSRLAKMRGKKMLFPCECCQKMCQTLSGLKLHARKHDPNAKRRQTKNKLNDKKKLNNQTVTNLPTPLKEGVERFNMENGYDKQKPLDENKFEQLKNFYEKNIKGDIEFCQFLKIYKRMSEGNMNDISGIRTDFGLNYDVIEKETEQRNEYNKEKIKVRLKRSGYSRVVKISKKEYLKRMDLKDKLRKKNNVS